MDSIDKLNEILNSQEMYTQLNNISSIPTRMCLNQNVIQTIRAYLTNVINGYMIFGIDKTDLELINTNFEKFLEEKFNSFNLENKEE